MVANPSWASRLRVHGLGRHALRLRADGTAAVAAHGGISALGLSASFRTLLGSNGPIVVERATYWPGHESGSGLMSGSGAAASLVGAFAVTDGPVASGVEPSRDPARPTPIVPVELYAKTGALRTPYDTRWPRLTPPAFYHRLTQGTPANDAARIASRGGVPVTPAPDDGSPPTASVPESPATEKAASKVPPTPQSLGVGSGWHGAHLTGGRPR